MANEAAGKTSQKGKGARRRMRLFLTLVCGFLLWAGVSLWEQAGVINEKQEEMQRLQVRLDQLRAEKEAYQTEVTRLHDDEYIEQRVRKDFGMVRSGDKVLGTQAP